ncbi:MAG TPA: glycosyltransferase family 2 protein [Micromonosporaceae bacterium]
MSTKVSVVIVNWNTRDLLDQTLSTLHSQTTGVAFETIVVDNGSTDGSAALVRDHWPRIDLVALPENRGFAAANNIGFARASGEYVLLLNSDTIVLPTTVRGLVDLLDRTPEAVCAGARHLNADGSLQRSVDDFPTLANDFLSYTELHRARLLQRWLRHRFAWWGAHDQVRTVGWVNGACMMVRRQVIETIGGLDEGFFIYAEEVDWCFRMWQAGGQVYFTPEAEVIHLGGQAMNNAAHRRITLKYLGQMRFYRKHYSKARQLALRSILAGNALVRLGLLVAFGMAGWLGMRPTDRVWQLVTQEPVRTSTATMLKAWWRILLLRPEPRAGLDTASQPRPSTLPAAGG